MKRALKILADREVTPQTGLLKSTLLQLDSTFSERNYGASSFLDFVEKLANTGFVHLKTSGRSVMVELNPGFDDGDRSRAASPEGEPSDAAAIGAASPIESVGQQRLRRRNAGAAVATLISRLAAISLGKPWAGLQTCLRTASRRTGRTAGRRPGRRRASCRPHSRGGDDGAWPMYLRNVKQILRAADNAFDERRYGFGGLMDLLRACQKENLSVSSAIAAAAYACSRAARCSGSRAAPVQPSDAFESQPIEVSATQALDAQESADADLIDSEPMPTVDPTAELLGRAKARRPRSRLAATPVAASEPAPIARANRRASTAARRSDDDEIAIGRARKKSSAADTSDDFGNR